MNSKTVSVTLHTVKSYDLQEKFSLSGEVYRKNNVNYIRNTVRRPLNIKEGAYAGVIIDGEYYDGYLRELEKLTQTTAVACVSVVSDEELTGQAEVEVYGGIAKNVIMIPENLIFKDENNCDSVMIARDGYCAKRNISVGEMKNSKGIQIVSGLLPDEKIVINYNDVKSGDRY